MEDIVIYSLSNIFVSAVDFCRQTARPIRFVVGLALNIYYYNNDDNRSIMSQVGYEPKNFCSLCWQHCFVSHSQNGYAARDSDG